MNSIKAELLINARSRQARGALSAIKAACEREHIELTAIHHLEKQPLMSLLQTIKKNAPSLLIIGGGDGTISNTIRFFSGTDIELGVIPLGTTNNFARSLNMPLLIDDAIRAIVTREAKAVDLGSANGHHFANVAGIGLSAVIAGGISDKMKRRYGRAAYGIEGMIRLFRFKPFMVTIQDKDRELALHFETRQIIVANGRFHAGREIAVDASLTNSELLIFPLGGRSILSFIKAMADFYIGKRKYVRHSSYLIGRDVDIKTDRAVPIELDGEVVFSTPVRTTVKASAVMIRGTR